MKPPKDQLGNELEVGDAIVLPAGFAGGTMMGFITEINLGGVVVGRTAQGPQVSKTRLKIQFEFELSIDPNEPTLGIVNKCYDPKAKENKAKYQGKKKSALLV